MDLDRLGRLFCVCAILLTLLAAPALDAQSPEQTGETTTGLPIVQISTSELMAMARTAGGATAAVAEGAAADLSVGTNFTAATFQEISATPPDGHIAAGPTQVV